MTTPLDRLAELVGAMTARPWRDRALNASGVLTTGVRYHRYPEAAPAGDIYPAHGEGYEERIASAVRVKDLAAIVALANVADELIAVARAADRLFSRREGAYGLALVERGETDFVQDIEDLRRALIPLNAKLEGMKA